VASAQKLSQMIEQDGSNSIIIAATNHPEIFVVRYTVSLTMSWSMGFHISRKSWRCSKTG
jgi:hypothetical protein